MNCLCCGWSRVHERHDISRPERSSSEDKKQVLAANQRLVDDLFAHWDGIQWTEVNEKTASVLRVAMRFARVSGYGELNPSITLLVPQDQRRIVEEHHSQWQRSRGLTL